MTPAPVGDIFTPLLLPLAEATQRGESGAGMLLETQRKEGEGMDYLVVGSHSFFEDDVPVVCAECGGQGYARPYTTALGLKALCIKCFALKHHPKPESVIVLERTIREVEAWQNRN